MKPIESFQPFYAPDGVSGGGMSDRYDREKASSFLEFPSSILAFGDVTLPPYSKPQLLAPQAIGLPFSIPFSADIAKIIEQTKASANLHLSSKFAQAGLDIAQITYDQSRHTLSGLVQNVGPFTLLLPAQHALDIGIPFLRSDKELSEPELDKAVDKFIHSNEIDRRKNTPPDFSKIRGFGADAQQFFMTIHTPRILVYPPVTKTVNLATLPRGTYREQLHSSRFIDMRPIEYRSISYEINSEDPDEILRVLGDRYGYGLDVPYALTETDTPIHYPPGMGIEITGGVVLNRDHNPDIWISHGSSVVGQHRDDPNRMRNPYHRLLSEFYYSVGDLLYRTIKEGQTIAFVCRPVNLGWAESYRLKYL